MSTTLGVPSENARHQGDAVDRGREEMARLVRDRDAEGQELAGEVIAQSCPAAVALHDRRILGSSAKIDHIVLVPSGVWIIDSRPVGGRIKIKGGPDGAQKLTINGHDRTELVDELTDQVNAVSAVVAEVASAVPVLGAFCFWLPTNRKRELIVVPDSGLPIFKVWTVNGYPLWYWRQMVRQLNSEGPLSAEHARELSDRLAARFPSVAVTDEESAGTRAIPRPQPATFLPPQPATFSRPQPATFSRPQPKTPKPKTPKPTPARASKQEFKARMEAERLAEWETARPVIEAALGCPVPAVLSDPLPSDPSIYCHHAMWHCRVYLACIDGHVGRTMPYKVVASVVGGLHSGRARAPQWKALTMFLEHLREHGYIELERGADSRVTTITVVADLRSEQ